MSTLTQSEVTLAVAEARAHLCRGLAKTQMTKPDENIAADRDSLLQETKDFIEERVTRVDTEIQEKQRENFKKKAKSLRMKYGQGGSKTMKKVMGKFGTSNSMRAVETDYPDTIVVQADDLHREVLSLIRHGNITYTCEGARHTLRCTKLDVVWDVVT